MRFAFALAPVLLVAACAVDEPPAPLVSVTPIAAGAQCAAGGTAIATGHDLDGDGTLGADEVEQTQYVCGARGGDGTGPGGSESGPKSGDSQDAVAAKPLVRLDVEPRGAHCASGGTAVRSGLDKNKDGALSDSEVTATQYVCSGDGPPPLIRVSDEPAGAHCAAGGTALRIGSDLDGDRVLSDAEVTSTQFLCRAQSPAVVIGHLLIHNSLEAAALVGVREVTGDVVVDVPGLDAVDLRTLERIGGSLVLRGLNTASLDLPSLTSVGGVVQVVGNQSLHLGAPLLATIGGDVTISGSPGLEVALPALRSVGGDLYLSGPRLDASSLPQLATIRRDINADHLVGALALPALTGSISISVGSSDLSALSLPSVVEPFGVFLDNSHVASLSLAAATTSVRIDIEQSTVDSLSAPVLASVALSVKVANSVVSAVAAPKLTSIGESGGGGLVVDNSHLVGFPWAKLRTVGGVLSIKDSGGLGDLKLTELVTTGGVVIVDNDLVGKRIALPKWTRGALVSVGATVRNNGVVDVSLPKIDVAGDLVIDEAQVTGVHLDALASAQVLEIANTQALASLSLPALRSVGNLLIDDNAALTALGAAGLVHSSQIKVTRNAALRGLGLTALVDGFTVQVFQNPRVPSCEAQALAARIHAFTIDIHDNDEAATCQ